jgi:hypothetical protein
MPSWTLVKQEELYNLVIWTCRLAAINNSDYGTCLEGGRTFLLNSNFIYVSYELCRMEYNNIATC